MKLTALLIATTMIMGFSAAAEPSNYSANVSKIEGICMDGNSTGITNINHSGADGMKTVNFTGNIEASTPCHDINHTVTQQNGTYILDVKPAPSSQNGTPCVQCTGNITYQASFESNDTFELEVQHKGQKIGQIEYLDSDTDSNNSTDNKTSNTTDNTTDSNSSQNNGNSTYDNTTVDNSTTDNSSYSNQPNTTYTGQNTTTNNSSSNNSSNTGSDQSNSSTNTTQNGTQNVTTVERINKTVQWIIVERAVDVTDEENETQSNQSENKSSPAQDATQKTEAENNQETATTEEDSDRTPEYSSENTLFGSLLSRLIQWLIGLF